MRRFVLAVTFLTISAGAVRANGFGENGSWQFQSPAAMTAMSGLLALQQEKNGGYFKALGNPVGENLTTNSTTNYPIGNMTSVTAGNGTTVNLTTNSSNSGSQSAGELNGTLP